MSLIFGEVWRVEDVLVFRKSTFFIINSCAFRFFFFDYARVEVTFRLFAARPCRLRQMKQNQDLINPGSVSLGTAGPENILLYVLHLAYPTIMTSLLY